MWPEVEKARSENRHELVLCGKEISTRILKGGLDCTVFQLTTLNYLNISQTDLSHVPDDIEKLSNLQTLVLHTNKIESVNDKIGSLEKLKVLDLSQNRIKIIPGTLCNLAQLTILNLNVNCIENFPSVLKKCTKLTVIDVSNNQLNKFPDICTEELNILSELKLSGNLIEEIPNTIHHLPLLKLLDLGSNKVQLIPGELSDCQKLKDVNLKGNPVSDRRLFKLIDQCRTKQILDYVKQHCPKTNVTNKSKEGNAKNRKKKQADDTDDESIEVDYKYTITVKSPLPNFKVILMNSVKNVREHFIGCIVNNIHFSEENFKKFMQLQNKLHDSICEKRNIATIATHDFNKLPDGDLKYTTALPDELIIKPLNRTVPMTGLELFTKLQTEANNLRKEKKRNTYSGIHKYLYLIEGKSHYACLLNSNSEVISLPPITNSDISKIDLNTKKIFIEVTSSTSLIVCKTVMDTLLKDMILVFGENLEVIQVKTTYLDSSVKNVYPSKNDLKFDKIVTVKVERDV